MLFLKLVLFSVFYACLQFLAVFQVSELYRKVWEIDADYFLLFVSTPVHRIPRTKQITRAT